MANLNKVMLIGNLTRDPEIKYTPKGQAIAELAMAINRNYTVEATGEKREEVTYVDVTLWGRQAEIAKEYLTKGRPVYIEGRLTLDTWDDKTTGQKRSKMRVTGEALQLLGSRGEGGEGGGSTAGGGGGGGSTGKYSSARESGGDDYDQRPSAPAKQAPSGGGSGPARPKAKPAAPSPDPDEEDDIPF